MAVAEVFGIGTVVHAEIFSLTPAKAYAAEPVGPFLEAERAEHGSVEPTGTWQVADADSHVINLAGSLFHREQFKHAPCHSRDKDAPSPSHNVCKGFSGSAGYASKRGRDCVR